MKINFNLKKWRKAFTWVELLVVLLMVGVMVFLFLPALSGTRVRSTRIKCVNNLKNVGLAFRIYAPDNGGKFPTINSNEAPVSGKDNPRLFSYVSNELSTARILYCPNDTGRTMTDGFTNLTVKNISYFANLDSAQTLPFNLLSGDRNLQGIPMTNGLMTVYPNSLNLSWTGKIHQNNGNVALGDGSVQQLSNNRLKDTITKASGIQRLLFPE